ncbi:MAG: hypothetical protein RJP95_01860, partial [Pirellulales bacterium]
LLKSIGALKKQNGPHILGKFPQGDATKAYADISLCTGVLSRMLMGSLSNCRFKSGETSYVGTH